MAFSLIWALPPEGGGRTELLRAVDEGDGASDPAGQLLGHAAGPDQLVAPPPELVDRLVHPLEGAGEQPDRLQQHQWGDGQWPPAAARGWGIPAGTGTTGTSHSPAMLTRAPPPATTTNEAPASKATVAASKVSSVSPENEMAKTSEPVPT